VASPGRQTEVVRSQHELDGETVADVKVAGGRVAGMARLDKGSDPHPKIERIAVTYNPPPVQESESQIAPAQTPRSQISSPVL
jgi:hypothetical protein